MGAIIRDSKPIRIVAATFSENAGGVIVLHYLCHLLRTLGYDAALYPLGLCKEDAARKRGRLYGALKSAYLRLRKHKKDFNLHPHPTLDISVASREESQDCIIVYSETISGNPVGAPHVVRFNLHRPGFFSDAETEQQELNFHYQPAFVTPDKRHESTLLRVRWYRDDVYRNRNIPKRSGACRMLRKGDPSTLPVNDTAISIDGLPHEEIAEIFNRCELFYCHDPYTMFYYYAALCGCTPILVPQPGLTADEWRCSMAANVGVAYGDDEVEWAKETRAQLLEVYASEREREKEMVLEFIARIESSFGIKVANI